MFYPEKLKPFIEFTKVLSDALGYIDEIKPEYTVVLHEDIDKLKPYLESSFPLIVDIYSKPLSDELNDSLSDGETVQDPSELLGEFQELLQLVQSQEFIDSLIPDNEDEFETFIEEQFPTLLAVAHTSLMNIKSYMKEKSSINQLLKNYTDGDEHSLFAAIRIDALVERVPVVANRISIAETTGDDQFLYQLKKARNKKRNDDRAKHRKLDFFLMLFFSFGILQALTESECAEIFINELDLYKSDEDSLKKYIARWKSNTHTYISRLESGNEEKSKT